MDVELILTHPKVYPTERWVRKHYPEEIAKVMATLEQNLQRSYITTFTIIQSIYVLYVEHQRNSGILSMDIPLIALWIAPISQRTECKR